MIGFFISILFLLFCLICVVYTSAKDCSKGRTERHDDSRYAKTGNFMDFDPGEDLDKIGDPKYPNAAIDSELKYEFMENLLDGDKN